MRQTVVLTGANRGIGLALARLFVTSGNWRVVAGCRNPDSAPELAALASENPDALAVHALDVADLASVSSFVAAIGERPVDLLLNNAGVLGKHQSLDDLDFEAWDHEFRVNTMGPMRLALGLLGNLRKGTDPRIVTISSQMGSMARPRGGAYAYRSTKAALNKAMQGLALDLSDDDICVVVMHPGWVRTDMGGSGADIAVEESAGGIFSVVTGLKAADTGRFLQWNGSEHDW